MPEKLQQTKVDGAQIAVFWLEQSHFVFKTSDGTIVHVDPFLSRDIKPEGFIHPKPVVPADEAYADFVLLTHDHRDHTNPYTLKPMVARNPGVIIYGPVESAQRCRENGIPSSLLREIHIGDRVTIGSLELQVLYAQNTGDHDETTHLGFMLSSQDTTIYITGDTRKEPHEYFQKIREAENTCPNAMIVPINEGYNNPGPAGASSLVEYVNPDIVIPCHFGCFTYNTIDPQVFIDAMPAAQREKVKIMERGGVLVMPE